MLWDPKLFYINKLFARQALANFLCTSGIGVPLARKRGWGDLMYPCSSERGGLRAALWLIHAVPQDRHSIYCRAAMRQRRTQARGFFYTLGAKSSNADALIKGIMKMQKMILLVYLTTSTARSLT